jgi:glycosyltransferase involved in cell wall biosynthesis
MLVSIIMPLFNEEKTAGKIIEKVLGLPLDLELIIVNNGSDDATGLIIRQFADISKVKIIDKEKNIGKGDAITTALQYAVGKYTIIQDGDLEYEPMDIVEMVNLAEKNNAPAVFGSRIRNPKAGISYQRYLWGGKLLTIIANMLYGVGITDESTCYKMVRTDIIKALNLECRRFEFCPELVAKLGRNGIKIIEIPINYNPRSFKEGKKIRWRDGAEAILTLLKYRFKPMGKFSVRKK